MYPNLIRTSYRSSNASAAKHFESLGLIQIKQVGLQPPVFDRSLLQRNPYEPKFDFSADEDVIRGNQERIADLAAIEKQRVERKQIQSEAIRQQKEEAIREAKRYAEEKHNAKMEKIRRKREEEKHKQECLKLMVECCSGLNDNSQAQFYLDACEWDVQAAINLWDSENGSPSRPQSRQMETTTAYIMLPSGDTIHECFDVNQLIISIFPVVYSQISEDVQLRVREDSKVGKELDLETMTTITFKAGGYFPTAVFYVEKY